MTRNTRRLIFLLFSMLFAASFIFIFLLAQGWRFDSQNLKFTKTGGIYIGTSQSGAKIYINDQYIQATGGILRYSRFVENLVPKNYEVLIYKEGFYPWNKTVEVKAGEVSEIKNIILFPINPKIEKLTAEDAESIIKLMPKQATSTDDFRIRKSVLEYLDKEENGWRTIDTSVRYLSLDLEGQNLLYATETKVKVYSVQNKKSEIVLDSSLKAHYADWIGGSGYVLAVFGTDLIVTETDNSGLKRNSVNILFNIEPPFFYDSADDIFYFSRDDMFYKTKLLSR